MNKQPGKYRKHLIALTGVVFALFGVNNTTSYANDISINIESVSVLMNGDVSISYTLSGEDASLVDVIEVYFFPELNPDIPPIPISQESPAPDQPIILRDNVHNFPSDSQGLEFQLWAYAGGVFQSRSRIHISVFLQSIEAVSQDGQLAIRAAWMNYAVFDPNRSFIEPPEFSHVDLMVISHDGSNCVTPGSPLRTFNDLSLWDQEEIVGFDGYSPGTYCFRMRARNNGGAQATSNMIMMEIETIFVPEVEIVSVHVDNRDNNIIINANTNADITNVSDFLFELYRSTDETNFDDRPQDILQGRDIDDPATIQFIDDVDIQDGPYFYKIKSVLIDDEARSRRSNVAPSMHLIYESVGIAGSDIELEFSWFTHDLLLDLYAGFEMVYSSENVQVIDFPDGAFKDDIGINQLGTSFFAFIEADQGGERIHSNQVQVILEILDRENISNAFRPNNPDSPPENRTFILPFIIDPEKYMIKIFDRNGLKVFEYEGDYDTAFFDVMAWNGRIMNAGQMAPDGAYIYHMQYVAPGNPQPIAEKGVVYLVR